MPFQRGTDPQVVALAYIEALHGLSAEAITEGVRKFLRGETDLSPKFVPTPPELARIVRTAVVPQRIPERKFPARQEPSQAERGRLKLKFEMFRAAFASPRMDELAQASKSGFEATVALAQSWGIPISDDTWAALKSPEAEQDWQRERNHAWHHIESSKPPFMRHGRAA